MMKNIKAWKSTIVGLFLCAMISLGVGTGKLSEEFLIALVPSVIPVFTNWFKEKTQDESEK